jgi:hypothetical protein
MHELVLRRVQNLMWVFWQIVRYFLSGLNRNWSDSTILVKLSDISFHKIHLAVLEFLHVDIRTNRRNELMAMFLHFVAIYIYIYIYIYINFCHFVVSRLLSYGV